MNYLIKHLYEECLPGIAITKEQMWFNRLFHKGVYFKNNGIPKPIAEKHKEQTVLKANDIGGLIKDAMKKTIASGNSENDW